MDKLTEEQFVEKASQVPKEDHLVLFKDVDGNWRGATYRYGQFVEVRDIGPETVLQLLLTHDGK